MQLRGRWAVEHCRDGYLGSEFIAGYGDRDSVSRMPRRRRRSQETIVYVDGFNVYYGAVKGTPYKWLDYEALCRQLLPSDNIVKIRYFTARVKELPDRPGARQRQNIYLRALGTLPLLEIHYSRFTLHKKMMRLASSPAQGNPRVEVLKPEEKGSDVNLATYLLLDALEKRCTTAVVISNDADLAEAIRIAQTRLGVNVGVVNPHPRSKRSRELFGLGCRFYRQVTEQALAQSQLPLVLADSEGQIHKPPAWNSSP